MAKDAKTKAKARVMYEAGKSSRVIAKALDISDHHTVLDWAEKGEWVKGGSTTKIAQKEEEGVLEAARRAGLSMETYFRGVRELTEAANVITTGPEGQVFQYPKPAYSAIQKDGQGREVAEFLGTNCEVVPNFGARKDGLKLFQESYPGLKAKDKLEVDVNPVQSILDRVRRGK